ncbi:redoxin domain-containing protein [Salinicoccus sp. ID82-1]|uniref:Redoxin domain-containing protein n=1 Tax=Salinicoccus cyprini TaxID=2493691 RepID=A0A558AZ18_9STAP|nr:MULTISPECIES: redoxin domain-containing protein [Salinicoccus]MCG1009071.1 redoxin domain-containing protein [Salinicoccus sp. ID82-1]TVT29518.1 redoxin domain-containing protein [Salinicoccus cyprini]
MKGRTRNILRVSIITTIALLIGITVWFNLTSGTKAVEVGDEAVDFRLTTLDGEEVQLSELTEDKGVILNFWGTWCKPCREEMPDMNAVYLEGHEDYEIVAVNVAENAQQIEQFISGLDADLEFPIAMDQSRSVTEAYNIGPLPTTIAVSKEGIVVKKQEYQLTPEDISLFISEATE